MAINSGAINSAAVNAAGGDDLITASLPLTQLVGPTAQVLLTQQVESAVLTAALRLTQHVTSLVTAELLLTQQVEAPLVTASLALTQEVASTITASLPLTQHVGSTVSVVPSPTMLPVVRVLLGGVDVSARLTDALEIDREAGQSAVLRCALAPQGGSIDLGEWISAAATVDFDIGAGLRRVFAGRVTESRYDPMSRVVQIDATDDLQQILDAMPAPVVDAVAGGLWSTAVFSADATGWQRAQDRMSTQAADLDRAPDGTLRVTPWAAAAAADWTFGPGGIVDGSLAVEPGQWREMVNRVKVDAQVRYARRVQRRKSFRWGYGGGLQHYLTDTSTIPDEDIIRRAANEAGWQVVSEHYARLPETGVYFGRLWVHNPDVAPFWVLGADLTAVRRWRQTVTETYALTVEAPASIARFGANQRTDRAAVEAPAVAEGWEDVELPQNIGGFGGTPGLEGALTAPSGDRYFDDLPAGLRDEAVQVALARARVVILAAHRAHQVSLDTPLLPDIDTPHTVRVETATLTAQGRVRQVRHRVQIGGEAVTTVVLALSQSAPGAQPDDPLVTPPAPDTFPAEAGAPPLGLGGAGTHLGARLSSPEESDDWTGWVGNYVPTQPGALLYDERFVIDWGEIGRDPIDANTAATVRVAVPHDLLEMSA